MTVGTPGIGVYVAFGNNPTDNGYSFTTDITKYVRTLRYSRGRQNELNKIESGEATLTLNDTTRVFDPDYVGSPYYPNVKPMKPIQVIAQLAGSSYYLMTHFIERWPRKRQGKTYAEREITTVDGFELLAQAGIAGKTYSQELSNLRIGHILDDAGWPTAMRKLGTGRSQIMARSFAATDSTVALSEIQDTEGTENGLFFINGQGFADFIGRNQLIVSPYSVSQATFTDIITVAGELPAADILPSEDKDLIFNDWRVTRSGFSSTQTAADTTSQNEYARRTQQLTSLSASDSDALSEAQYKLAIYKEPLHRIDQITLKPGNNQELWKQCLQRELGDRITVKEHPPPAGSIAVIRDYLIQRIEATFQMGPVTTAEFVWSLWPADTNAWFILDDAVNGVLDSSKLGY